MSTRTHETATAAFTRLTGPGGEFEIAREDVSGAQVLGFARRARSLGDVLSASARYGERDYIVTATDRISFAEHADRVAAVAAELHDGYGVGKGDRVAVLAANSPEWIIAFWATVSLGAIAVGYNAWWTSRETDYALGHTRPKVVFADEKRAAVLAGASHREIPVLRLDEDLPAIALRRARSALPECPARDDDPAVILYTSGTSGPPKGVVHSHRNVTSVIEYHRLNNTLATVLGDPCEPADKRYLLALPLFHIASLHNLAVPRLADGSAAVLHQGRFDVDTVLRLVESKRVTNWGAVPTMANRLIEHDDLACYDLSSLTAFSLASAPSSPEFKRRLRAVFPAAARSLVDSYGLTETATGVSVATAADLAADPGTLGSPVAGIELEIRDSGGTAVADGAAGEVCVRGPYCMVGYWDDPDATTRAIRDGGWLHTGDIGTVENGRLHLSSRRSDLILRGGENVYPAEIENALMEHPAVGECVVLGTPHDDLGQEVAAVVVIAADITAPHERELADFLRERIAYFKVPSRWRITRERLPRNAIGKVVRNQISV